MAEQENDPQQALETAYRDLGIANGGTSYDEFLKVFKSEKKARELVYRDLGVLKEGYSSDELDAFFGVQGPGINPQKVKQPSLSPDAKSVGDFIPEESRDKILRSAKGAPKSKVKKPSVNTNKLQPQDKAFEIGYGGRTTEEFLPQETKNAVAKKVKDTAVLDFDTAIEGMKSYQDKKVYDSVHNSGQYVAEEKARKSSEEKAYWDNVNEVTLSQSLKNSVSNSINTMKTLIPQTVLFSADTYEAILGKELTQSMYNLVGENIGEKRADALNQIALLKNEVKPTKGNIADNIAHLNGSGLIANLGDAIGSLAATAIPALATGGASTVTMMGGDALYSYNQAKAESLGITQDQLYKDGRNEFKTPFLIGLMGSSLELVGLHSVKNLVSGKFTGAAAKRASLMAWEVNKEGLTETLQGGLETANKKLGEGGTEKEAAQEAFSHIFSKEGFNEYAMGVFASGGAAVLGRMTQSVVSPTKRVQAEAAVSELTDLESDLKNESVPLKVRESIEKVATAKVKDFSNAINDDIEAVESLPAKSKAELDSLNQTKVELSSAVEDSSLSDTSKKYIQEELSSVDSKIEEIMSTPNVESAPALPPVPEKSKERLAQMEEERRMALEEEVAEESAPKVTEPIPDLKPALDATSEAKSGSVYEDSEDKWTHLTNHIEAVEEMLSSGQFLGKGEKLENFTKEVSTKLYDPTKQNGASPYFQKGKLYGGGHGQKYLIVARGDENFTPNIFRMNAKSLSDTKGVGVLNPDHRDASNFEVYVKNDTDGKYYLFDSSTFMKKHTSNPVKAGDVLRSFAEKARSGKINKLGGFRAGTGFDSVWDMSLEVVAKSLEGGAVVVDAIQSGLKSIKESDWYKNLDDKSGFDKQYTDHMREEYNLEEERLKSPPVKAKVSPEEKAQLDRIQDKEKADAKLEKVKAKSKEKLTEQKESAQTREDNIRIVNQENIRDIKKQHSDRISEATKSFTKKLSETKEDAKDRAASHKDLMSTFSKDIKEQISQSVKSGILKGQVNAGKVKNLLNKINNSDTPIKMLDAADYVYKTLSDIDYDNKIKTSNSLLSKIKSLSKRKGLPANIASAMRSIGQVKPTDAASIDALNLSLQSIVDGYKGVDPAGLNTAVMDGISKSIKSITEGRSIQRYTAILNSAGVSVPANATMKEINILMSGVNTKSPAQVSDTRIANEIAYGVLKPDLYLIDESLLTERKKEALRALKSVDVSKLDDSMVHELMLATKNAIENGDYSGTVRIINANRMIGKLSNTDLNARTREATRVVSKIGSRFRSNWATVTAQVDAITRNRYTLPHLTGVTGFDRIRDSFSVFKKRFEHEVIRPLEALADKYGKYIDDNKNQILLSMYADLNNGKRYETPLEAQTEFDGRKKAIKRSIEVLEKRSRQDKVFADENKSYIANLNAAYDLIEKTANPSEIYSLLNPGSRALYDSARSFFDANKADLKENAEIDNNIVFDDDIINYFPRQYDNVLNTTDRQLSELESLEHASGSTMFATAVTSKATSGAQKSRLISGEALPDGKAINFRFVETYMQASKNALYDIETQANRQYAAYALNNKALYEVFGDRSGIDVMRNAMIHNVNNQRNVVVGGVTDSMISKILSAYQTTAVRMALGGTFQAIKQAGSAITETALNLGSNSHLLIDGFKIMTLNSDHANALMDQFAVGRRAQDQSFRGTVDVKGKDLTAFKKRLKHSFVTSGLRLADDVIEFIALKSLKAGDDFGAKVSWLAYYMDYKRKNLDDKTFDVVADSSKPNMDAAAYAEHMTSLTLNINDASLKPKGRITAILAPFASFNINAKISLASNLSRLRQIKDHSSAEGKQLIKLISGNLGSMLFMNTIGLGIRRVMIGGSALLVSQLLGRSGDLDDKDEEKIRKLIEETKKEQIETNIDNSIEYLAKDLIYGGIAAGITDPIYDQAKDALYDYMDWEKKKKYVSSGGIEDALGLFSIPVRTATKVYKNFSLWNQTNDDFLMERYGVEDAYGEKIVMNEKHSDELRNGTIKGLYGMATIASMVQMTGLSSQEVSAVMSRSVSLGKKIDDELSSKKNKEKVNDLINLKTITLKGRKIELSDEQYEFRLAERRKYLDKYYKMFESSAMRTKGRKFDRAEFEAKMKTRANAAANRRMAMRYKELRQSTISAEIRAEEDEKYGN